MKISSPEFAIRDIPQFTFEFIERKSRTKYFFPWLIFWAILISLFTAFPSYDVAYLPEMDEGWSTLFSQSVNPFERVEYNPASHSANMVFRLTPPLLVGLLNINTITGVLIIQFLILVLAMTVWAKLFRKIVSDPVVYTLLLMGISMTFMGNVLCSDYRGFFDGMAYLLLAIALLSGNYLVVLITLMLAYFTDERALIASSLIFIYFIVENNDSYKSVGWREFFSFPKKVIVIVGSWGLYFILRFSLTYWFGLKTNSEGLVDYLLHHSVHQLNLLPFALWTGLEGFWLIVILTIIAFLHQKKIILLTAFLGAMSMVVFSAMWVFDITRSMSYLMPALFLSLLILSKELNPLTLRFVSFAILIGCLFPTYYAGGKNYVSWFYPLPLQLLRMYFL